MYHYLDFSNGLVLRKTNDPNILTQLDRVFIGTNLTDEQILAMLRTGIVGRFTTERELDTILSSYERD